MSELKYKVGDDLASMVVADSIDAITNYHGITQKELGVWLGVSSDTVSRWKRGERLPNNDNAKKLEEMARQALRYHNNVSKREKIIIDDFLFTNRHDYRDSML